MSSDFFIGMVAAVTILLFWDLFWRRPHVHDYGEWTETNADQHTTPELYRLGLRVIRYQRCACGKERYLVGKAE